MVILTRNINFSITNMLNNSAKFSSSFLLFLAVSLIISSLSFGQGRVSYRDLSMRNQQRNIYFDFFTLPGQNDGTIKLVSTFRVDYNFLPFKKMDRPQTGREFFSPLGVSMEVFKAERKRKPDDNIPVDGLESVSRAAWKDTAFAATYEQTQSDDAFISGYLEVELKPGLYNYMLQLAPGEDTRERTSRARQIDLKAYEKQKTGDVLLVDKVRNVGGNTKLDLLTFGQNVYFGKDFQTLIHLPGYKEGSSYTLRVNRIDISRRDTTQQQQVFEQEITQDQIRNHVKPVMDEASDGVSISLNENQDAHTYALVKIPNSTFPNAVYRITVVRDNESLPVARGVFRSLWLEMPTSLLNLDVATQMLKYIVSDAELKHIRSGSEAEREQKFRDFWKAKDPTPKTEYNELMAEFYRRIDYAYEHFTTTNNVGYESDQGEIYIKYGPPNNIERKFPTGDPAVEIWTYDNRKFVFQATSGFGDFRLVSR